MLTGRQCENVVCDVHRTDMRSVEVRHSMGVVTRVVEGFACSVAGCVRFFGTEGYNDLTDKSEFANIRSQPSCSRAQTADPMYIQRTKDGLRWVCSSCGYVTTFSG